MSPSNPSGSAEHTPGPWRWTDPWRERDAADAPLNASRLAGGSWQDVLRPNYPTDIRVREADGNLIAAAPDLLAACEAAYADELAARNNGSFITDGSMEKLRAAIAKARPADPGAQTPE